MHHPWLPLLLLLVACSQDDEVVYVQFNTTDNSVELPIGGDELLDPVTVPLTSSTGEVEIGWAEVDPGGGPIGTSHQIVLEVFDDYQERVARTSVRISSEGRGEDEFDLDQDSADEGYFKRVLVTNGADGETRTDTLTFRLWEAEDDTTSSSDDEADE